MKWLILLASMVAAGQSHNILKIIPDQNDTATGSIRWQEKYGSGSNYFSISSPATLAANVPLIAPSALPATSGECVKSTTGGVLSFGSCDSLWTGSGSDIYRNTGKVGIGTNTPTQTLHAFWTSASPATSGTTQGGIARIAGDATNTLDIGAYASSPFGLWLQGTNVGALGTTYPLILNPNGGNVGIGMTNPTSTLHVTGTATVTSTSVLSGNVTMGANLSMSGAMTPALDGTGTIGSSGNRYTSAHLYSLNVGGGSGTITFLPGSAPTVGHVWTATSTGGVGAWQAVSVTAPLTLTLGASGYSQPLTIANDTVGLNGSCLGVAGHDSGATVYTLGRLCAKFESALFTDEIVELQTATGSGTYATAQSWKNLTTTIYGNTTIASGSSLLMDRATRATNQKVYWTVAGNPSTTGAWSVGTVPSGAASRWIVDHNGTEVLIVNESGQIETVGTVITGGNLTVTGSTTGDRFNATSSDPFRVAGTTVIDSSRNASFANLTLSGTVSSSLSPTSDSTYSLGAIDNEWLAFFADQVTVTSYVRPKVDNGGTDGSSSRRWSAGYWYTGDFAGVLTLGSTVTGDLLPTTNNTYVIGNTTTPLRWASVNGVNANFSGDTTVGGALIPDIDGGADIGTSSLKFANSYFNTVNIYGTLIPDTTNTRSLGSSTRVWNNFFTNNIRIDGTVTPPSGTAFSGTKTVRAAGGAADCTLTFSSGIMTGGTC